MKKITVQNNQVNKWNHQIKQKNANQNDELKEKVVEMIRMNHTGEGIGKIDGKIIFVPKTIPGDIVEVTSITNHKTYYKGKVKKLITPSPNRVHIDCPYYETCGGCQLLGMSYENQLAYKQEKVKNILKQYANINTNPPIVGGCPYHYRNKMILQVENGKLGLYESESNTLVPIDACLLISDALNHLLNKIATHLDLSNVTQILIREGESHQRMVQFLGKIDVNKMLECLKEEVTSLYLNETLIFGNPTITEKLGQYSFEISPHSFFQINHIQTEKLYHQVKEYLGMSKNRILDLYCGTGSIGIYVSECAKKITGIELNSSSVKDARKNIKNNYLKNIEILEGDVGKILQAKEQQDAIIVDPPRSGLDKKTKQTLLQIKSPTIIYISCNPITLARDLKDLSEIYHVQDIILYDLFPNTYHVEVISYMTRKY